MGYYTQKVQVRPSSHTATQTLPNPPTDAQHPAPWTLHSVHRYSGLHGNNPSFPSVLVKPNTWLQVISYSKLFSFWRLLNDIHPYKAFPYILNFLPPTTVYIGNQSAISIAQNRRQTRRRKHVDDKYHYLADHTARQIIHIQHIPSAANPSDAFTKALSPSLVARHTSKYIQSNPRHTKR